MTDLEEMWDGYEPRPLNTSDLTRQARVYEAARRRKRVNRPIAGLAVAGLVVGAFTLGSQINPTGTTAADQAASAEKDAGDARSSGDSEGTGGMSALTNADGIVPVSFVSGLKATTCEDLLTSYRERGASLVGPWGWNGGGWGIAERVTIEDSATVTADLSASKNSAYASDPVTGSATGTNTQEAAVDEPDIVKTNGTLLARIGTKRLEIFDIATGAPKQIASMALYGKGGLGFARYNPPELLLVGENLVVTGLEPYQKPSKADATKAVPNAQDTRVSVVSLATPAKPALIRTFTTSAQISTARQDGATVRFVASTPLPDLDFVTPSRKVSQSKALKANRALVATSTLDDWLPSYDAGAGDEPLIGCDRVALPDADLALGTTVIMTLDLANPETLATDAPAPEAVAIAAEASTTYATTDRLYLAGGTQMTPPGNFIGRAIDSIWPTRANTETSLFSFALSPGQAKHVASGTVKGNLRDRWSMDSVDGVLRVAVGLEDKDLETSTSVVTFTESDEKLVEAGRVDGLGIDETLQSVRWFDDVGYLVTFRQIDPLYAVDLTDPAKPTVLSELKIPGFSSYLHPIGGDRLLGVGSNGSGSRAKVSLFDLSDPAKVIEEAAIKLAKRTSPVTAWEPRAFTWLDEAQTAVTPIDSWSNGPWEKDSDGTKLALIKVTDEQTLSVETREIHTNWRSNQVRVVTTASGEPILVTPNEVTKLKL